MPAEPRQENAEAVAHAGVLATALDAELLLLGVVPLPALGPLTAPPEPDGMVFSEAPEDAVMRRQLARTKARLGSAVRARTLLGWGPAAPAIVDAAREEAADLVVVPRGDGRGLAHPLHGSTARHVVQHCSVPVLVVPGRGTIAPGTRAPGMRRLLVAVEGSAGVVAALDVAAGVARSVGGTLTLLMVAPLAAPPGPGPPAGIAAGQPEQQVLLDRLARERLDELVGRVGEGLDVRGSLSWGPAGPAIVEAAETGDYDVVVIPWPERGALGHLLHDHAARHALDHCPLPVLAVPAGRDDG